MKSLDNSVIIKLVNYFDRQFSVSRGFTQNSKREWTTKLIIVVTLCIFLPISKLQAENSELCSVGGSIFSNAENLKFVNIDWIFHESLSNISSLLSIDATQDGCDDILFIDSQKFELKLSTSDCKGRFLPSITLNKIHPTKAILGTADFNGDGMKDLLIHDAENSVWSLMFFNQIPTTSTEIKVISPFGASKNNEEITNLVVADFDGNNHADILTTDTNYPTQSKIALNDTHLNFSVFKSSRSAIRHLGRIRLGTNLPEVILWQNSEITGNNRWYIQEYKAKSNTWKERVFLGFQEYLDWGKAFIGDFNADSRDDLIIQGPFIYGWSVAFSNGTFGFEIPIAAPYSSVELRLPEVVGDFNGDGISDILRFTKNKPNPSLSLGTLHRIKDYSLAINGETIEIPKATETYKIQVKCNQEIVVKPNKEGFAFFPASRKIFLKQDLTAVSFYASETAESKSEIGQAFSIGAKKQGPYVCLGYNPGRVVVTWGLEDSPCPENHAYYSLDDEGNHWFKYRPAKFPGWCCPLPKDDILLDHSVYAEHTCPENYIATGAKSNYACNSCKQYVLCTLLNTKRYELGPETPGVYWGTGMSARSQSKQIERAKLPIAIRYGIGRLYLNKWDVDGCIGEPFGSLFTRREMSGRGNCQNYIFRELRYRGIKGDPPSGTPVKMFPDCKKIINIYSPLSGCEAE